MRLSYKYRLYPNRAQIAALGAMLDAFCDLFNAGLQQRIEAYRRQGKTLRYADQANELKAVRAVDERLAGYSFSAEQQVLRRLDKAFQAFFRRLKERNGKAGFPRFRSRKRYDSFTYAQSGFALKDGKLRLSKIGDVRIKLHRPIEGKIKTLTITRSATGKWFA